MKRSRKEQDLAKFREASCRISEIYDEMRKLPMEKLEKKLFVGHWRFLKVRADVLRSSIGSQVDQVVQACNTWVRGKKRSPKSYRCSTEVCIPIKGSYKHGFQSYQTGQGLRPLSEEAFEKAGLPEFFKTKWFNTMEVPIKVGSKVIIKHRYYPKVPAHMLEFDYKPAYIEEIRAHSGDLEGELKRLYEFMAQNDGWKKIGNTRCRDEWDLSVQKKKLQEEIRRKEARQAMQGLDNL